MSTSAGRKCGAACGGGGSNGGAGGGGGSGSGGATGSGGSGANGAGGTVGTDCNTLTLTGNVVVPTAGVGTAPTPAGGTIADGTYLLTKDEVFAPQVPAVGIASRSTLRIAGNQMESIWEVAYMGSIVSRYGQNSSFSATGATLAETATCSSASTLNLNFPVPYTATATTFVTWSTDVWTYTKQ